LWRAGFPDGLAAAASRDGSPSSSPPGKCAKVAAVSDTEPKPDDVPPPTGDAPGDTGAGAARPKRDRNAIRLAPYTGPQPPPTVPIHRGHSIPGQEELVFDDGGQDEPPLSLPDGAPGQAELALGLADPQGARALVEDPATAPETARAVRARAALMSGDVESARRELGDDREAPAVALADAALALAEGDVPRAARRVADALFLRPDGLGERYLYALVKVAEGDMMEAISAFSEVARSAPTHAVARYQLGQLLLATGDPARAGTLFEMAWNLQPSFVAPALALAEMLTESRQYGEALNLVGQVCDVAPEALAPRLLQLRVLLEVGERESALQLSSVLFARAPQELDVALLHAEALAENEKAAEAQKVLDEVIARPGVDNGVRQRARRQLARLALAERPPRAADAIALFKEAAAAGGPLAGELCIELFHVCIAVGRRSDAEETLELLAGTGDVGSLISGAILARSHAMWPQARRLGELARGHVAGTAAEAQLDGFLATIP
jgi:tetratricopeptide (TPR) repeat protein